MKICFWLVLISTGFSLYGQTHQSVLKAAPLDDYVVRQGERVPWVLPYPELREADILWEKRIWRLIDTQEKMNLIFRYPPMPFITLLNEAVLKGQIKAYHPIDDKFSDVITPEELRQMLNDRDTVEIMDPETYEIQFNVVENDFDPETVKRYRVKEVWYFDTRVSQLKVRILGIAPLREVFDESGNFRYETPLYWVYYPHIRKVLAQYHIFNPVSDQKVMSWEDLWEMRFFSSVIIKESNMYDRRIEDYLSGVDAMLEAEKIKQEIFNFEHDLWSY